MPRFAPERDCAALVITDREALGLALTRIAYASIGTHASISSITYPETISLLTPTRIMETDFLILELLRSYPGGQRAEGVTLAERWLYQKPFLIISPLHLAQHIQCPGYWDTESEDSLCLRIQALLRFPYRCPENFEQLKASFSGLLNLPPQH